MITNGVFIDFSIYTVYDLFARPGYLHGTFGRQVASPPLEPITQLSYCNHLDLDFYQLDRLTKQKFKYFADITKRRVLNYAQGILYNP
ncbi:hypothetical protein phiYS61_32 [Weissella phage phiYS61]|uniref:hypothetical protein n=1 Tax=Weissella phage phiYS61 TaxID=1161906 RepID=UPI000274E247|nr:hypothetical protein phiYS61_32 [Weissella phage phiYS61]AFF27990.1 hypothetical protein phiYS61_32 [Weissella phage phiYS61]